MGLGLGQCLGLKMEALLIIIFFFPFLYISQFGQRSGSALTECPWIKLCSRVLQCQLGSAGA